MWEKKTTFEPGFYWCSQNNSIRMVHIWQYNSQSTVKGMFTNEDGGASVNDKMYATALWYGPIVPPGLST